jgi:hypothetical protein
MTATNVSNAKKCKTEKDPFTGEKVVLANLSAAYIGDKLIYLENIAGKTKFELMWSYPGSFNTMVEKGVELLFKLKDGEIVKLKTITDARPKLGTGVGGVFSSYTFEMELEKVTLNKFASVKIEMLRIPDLKSGSADLDKKMPNGKICFNATMKCAKYLIKNI